MVADKLLLREKKMMSLRHPTPRNHLSVLNYIWNKKMIVEDEADYISHSDDLVSLAPEEDSYVQGLLEEYVFSLQVPFFQVFPSLRPFVCFLQMCSLSFPLALRRGFNNLSKHDYSEFSRLQSRGQRPPIQTCICSIKAESWH